jgi:hypothetical protein
MKEQKKHIKRDDLKNASHLEVSVYYSKGGYSYFSGQKIPRGYYISVRPVSMGNGTISFDLLAGCTKLLLATNRYSDKQFAQAIELASACENELIDAVMKKQAA